MTALVRHAIKSSSVILVKRSSCRNEHLVLISGSRRSFTLSQRIATTPLKTGTGVTLSFHVMNWTTPTELLQLQSLKQNKRLESLIALSENAYSLEGKRLEYYPYIVQPMLRNDVTEAQLLDHFTGSTDVNVVSRLVDGQRCLRLFDAGRRLINMMLSGSGRQFVALDWISACELLAEIYVTGADTNGDRELVDKVQNHIATVAMSTDQRRMASLFLMSCNCAHSNSALRELAGCNFSELSKSHELLTVSAIHAIRQSDLELFDSIVKRRSFSIVQETELADAFMLHYWPKNPAVAMEWLMKHMDESCETMPLPQLANFIRQLRDYDYVMHSVDIDPDGKCSHCNHKLRENHRLTDAEFGQLKTAIEQYAGLAEARQDIFPGELSALRSTVESLLRKPPKRAVVSKLSSAISPAPSSSTELCRPMVVDGLALIEQFRLFGKSLHLIAHLIEAQAVEEYWPILLIDRPERTRKYVSPFLDLVKQGVRRVCSNNAWANDALVMYAALCMGPGAHVLTDDNFVSHALQFRPADAKLLRRWASSNLLYVDRALRGNCVQKPASFAVESQIDGDACHIPVLLMRGGAQTCVQWICVRKRHKSEEMESASETMEEKEIARKRPEEKEAVQEKTTEEDPGEPKAKKVSNKRKRGRPLKAIY